MILLIFFIYVMVSGKLMISKNYGLSGSTARWAAISALVIGYAVAASVQAATNQGDYSTIIGGLVQIIVIILTVAIVTKFHGNDFGTKK